VAATRQKHLVLILARELVSNLATPTIIIDDRGWIVFFNEAAEETLGLTFAEVGELPVEEFSDRYEPRSLTAEPRPFEKRPAGIALYERRPAHERLKITLADGDQQEVAITAIPLFAHKDEFVGVVNFWWQE
jgi:PAS domain S-box-containing protein